jgi:hypothetical protein
MAQQRVLRVHLHRQHLALERPHRRLQRIRHAGDAARPGAGRQNHDVVGTHPAFLAR